MSQTYQHNTCLLLAKSSPIILAFLTQSMQEGWRKKNLETCNCTVLLYSFNRTALRPLESSLWWELQILYTSRFVLKGCHYTN
jgi:hypothetical protein